MKTHKKPTFDLRNYSEIISRILMVVLVMLMIGVTIWISGPLPQRDSEGMIITPQTTPIGNLQTIQGKTPDILETTPTSGVILAALGVVLVVLGGTAITFRSQK
jgi:hypothetical protein